ncbi:MAG TPA: 50S ribosomal protein L4 [Patescibacteria group bacterium]|nr:50S ribosomal protein L4 [Patescibacteria group bacterium]
MVKASIYTIKGTKTGDMVLPKEVFEVKPNLNMLAQAIHVYEERGHVGTRNTQTRSEVNRTTKKVYKQKGTGGARHGSRRANLFVGGGVIFGPRPERRELTLSSAMRAKAKVYAFSLKAGEKEIVVVEGVAKIAKTKEAAGFLKNLTKETGAKRFTFVLSEKGLGTRTFLRNLAKVNITSYKDISALDIYNGGMLVLDSVIFEKEKEVKKEELKAEKAIKTVKAKAKIKTKTTK